MRAVVIYRAESEHARAVEEYLDNFKRQTGRELETLDPDSKEGRQFCETYDILEYPSILALSDDGHMQNLWRGLPLPTINEVSYYN
ncbi:hypothetical protein RAAC3_TM7C00001G0530 [Candidatus Saccharibacteria bacterium RAAC3_TM7_1]|nr:hypothetical protein RAAC3_TM7C00001G0530 [Candidatus Saccharibacteria bacterium RAAC3_TM7_1]HCZ28657.1 hypothetical protein [Candidatus Saccharibacteria bacterium]